MTRRILFIGGLDFDGSVRRRLGQKGFAFSTANDSARANQLLTESRFDLVVVILDETEAGLHFIEQMRSTAALRTTSVLAIGEWGTGQPTVALTAGADAYEPTPIDGERLVDAVERILNKRATVVGMNN